MEPARTAALSRATPWITAAVVLVALAPAAAAPLWDADVWWILRAGADLLSEGRVPRYNRYSFAAASHPWVMHEWAFGAVYALLARASLGCVALVRVAAVATVAAASLRLALRDARPWVASACVALALLVYGGRFESPRPVGMTYALASLLAAVTFGARFTRRHALASALVTLAWTNLHGSFPLALATIALGALSPDGARRARLAALALACAATLANPYGLAMHGLVARYVQGDRGDAASVVHARILEWWPLWRDPLRVASAPELALAAALALVWAASLRDARWRPRALLGLGLLAMALRHNRHLQLAGLVGLPLAAGPVESLLARGAFEAPPVRWRAIALTVGVPTALALALWAAAMRSRDEGAWVDASRDDEDFRAALDALPDGSRAFVELPFTGYAIYRGYPRVRVLFDSRNDCYPAGLLRDAMDVNDGLLAPAEALALLRAGGATHALVRCRSAAARSFATAPLVARRGAICAYGVLAREIPR